MAYRGLVLKLTALVFMSVQCEGHLCLIFPRQRGDMDISVTGSRTCFRHGAPCGGEQAAPPTTLMIAGQQVFFKWQQNFNHYEVGYPGYMDVAIAPLNSDNFTQLAFVTDSYVHAQDYHHNFTAVATIPNAACDHCVIRARYQSHKAGETTFYQCADVKIVQMSKTFKSQVNNKLKKQIVVKSVHRLLDLQERQDHQQTRASSKYMLQGLAYNGFNTDTVHFVNVSLENGNVSPLNTLKLGVASGVSRVADSAPDREFLMDAIAALNPGQGEMLTVYHHGGSMEDGAKEILVFFTRNGSVETKLVLQNFDGTPISAMLYVRPRTYVTFGLEEDKAQKGTFYFVMGEIQYVPGTGLVYDRLYKSEQTYTLYVNYLWAEYDPDKGYLYVLMGNENAPDTLDARIYTYDFNNKSFVRVTDIIKSDFTFMSMQLHRESGNLYAVAPSGLYAEKRPGYSVIQVDPITGSVTQLFSIVGTGIFERYYGGTIFNGIDQDNGVLYKVMRLADTVADVIIAVNIKEKTTRFSQLCNLRHVHNLSLSPL